MWGTKSGSSRYHIMVLSKRRCDLVIIFATLEEPGPRLWVFILGCGVMFLEEPRHPVLVAEDVCLLINGGCPCDPAGAMAAEESCCSWSTGAPWCRLSLAREGNHGVCSRLCLLSWRGPPHRLCEVTRLLSGDLDLSSVGTPSGMTGRADAASSINWGSPTAVVFYSSRLLRRVLPRSTFCCCDDIHKLCLAAFGCEVGEIIS